MLVGPSGCGKSTLLRMIAGLEEVTSGEILIGERVVNDVPAKSRDIAMVFQSYALYPHMSVYENMSFSLRLRKEPKGVIDRKVRVAPKLAGDQGWRVRTVSRLLVLPDDRTARRRIARHAATVNRVMPARTRAARTWIRRPVGTLGGVLFLPSTPSTTAKRRTVPGARTRS